MAKNTPQMYSGLISTADAVRTANHPAVADNKTASIVLTVFIHGPGFGIIFEIPGAIDIIKYGADIPMPMAKNIAIISIDDPERAKPIVVPTSGAEQGVARSVATNPCPMDAKIPFPFVNNDAFVLIDDGMLILKYPAVDNAKIKITRDIMPRKIGFWN